MTGPQVYLRLLEGYPEAVVCGYAYHPRLNRFYATCFLDLGDGTYAEDTTVGGYGTDIPLFREERKAAQQAEDITVIGAENVGRLQTSGPRYGGPVFTPYLAGSGAEPEGKVPARHFRPQSPEDGPPLPE